MAKMLTVVAWDRGASLLLILYSTSLYSWTLYSQKNKSGSMMERKSRSL